MQRPEFGGWRRAVGALGAAALLATGLAACGGTTSTVPTVNFYIGTENSGAYAHAVSSCNLAHPDHYHIDWQQLPSTADNQRQQLVRRSAAGDTSLDILGLDVTWTAEFASAKWILPWTGANAAAVRSGTLSGPLATATFDRTLYGAPFNSNTELLWYRSDLVPTPPTTWSQMIADATQLAKAGKPHYIEEQGASYEGLTVWFNSLVASAGGSILTDGGTKVGLGRPAVEAATTMRDLARSPGGDPSLSVDMEDQGRLAFENNTAAFEINYPFVYPSAKQDVPKIYKVMRWARFPSVTPGMPGKSSIGGYNLAVSRYTPHPAAAFAAAACLRDAANQKVNATLGGLPPTLASLYKDPTVRASYPFADDILAQLSDAAVRPITPAYENVTRYIQVGLSPPANISPTGIIASLHSKLNDALQSKGILP